jgi:hypothetical protein
MVTPAEELPQQAEADDFVSGFSRLIAVQDTVNHASAAAITTDKRLSELADFPDIDPELLTDELTIVHLPLAADSLRRYAYLHQGRRVQAELITATSAFNSRYAGRLMIASSPVGVQPHIAMRYKYDEFGLLSPTHLQPRTVIGEFRHIKTDEQTIHLAPHSRWDRFRAYRFVVPLFSSGGFQRLGIRFADEASNAEQSTQTHQE